jgi:dipeptidyl aminopeptidase/acylaminoacyl peptidase
MILSGYGTWKSPITAARVASGSLRFDHLVADGDDLYWVEGRAAEGGRHVIVRRSSEGRLVDVTPEGFNVRTRVHEYGGAAYTVHDGVVYFSNFADQVLYRHAPGEAPRPLTSEGSFYADAAVDAARGRLLCVREDHSAPGEPVNSIVAVRADGGGQSVLIEGADFYSDPCLSPDGKQMAWLEWRHPNMPWDATELWVAAVSDDGSLRDRRQIAGGINESVCQPRWSPDGVLHFVSDRTGFWNLYRARGGGIDALHPMACDFGKPQWTFSPATYDFMSATELIVCYTEDGWWKAARLDTRRDRFDPLSCAFEPTDGIQIAGGQVFCLGGSATQPMSVARLELSSGTADIVRASTQDHLERACISAAEPVTFLSAGQPVHAFYYAPRNADYAAPDGERPPLLVMSHGGPTMSTTDVLDARIQFWTSRGFAVIDVNYGGSSGYGRAYRDRLKGQWGVVDVNDCVNAALHLVDAGKADANRLIIRGGSAGGYTTLAALTFHDVFTAGASYYGISDIEVLARDTHKFESRYLDSLIGPYPQARDRYRDRSPIHFTDRLSCALILFQGLEDKVVPPNQSEMMAEAVRRKGLPVAYVTFAGEQHGFRKAENIIRSLEAELYFYGAVFGFQPADPIEPVDIDNLPRGYIPKNTSGSH